MRSYKKPKGKNNHKYNIYQDGDSTLYYRYGHLHREEGPAYIDNTTKHKIYYRYGKKHRNDGPAEMIGDEHDFYLGGIRYDFPTWLTNTDVPDNVKAHLILLYG